jgi:hypothetical protein
MHPLASNVTLGALAASAVAATLAFGMSSADGWVRHAASTPRTVAAAAPTYAQNIHPAAFQTPAVSLPRAGDEGYWLNPTTAERPTVLPSAVALGDRITIAGKADVVRILEVIEIKALARGLLSTKSTPSLSVVTAKVVGGDGALTRFIIEDAIAAPATPLQPTANKAL